jgi:hypothetical protein
MRIPAMQITITEIQSNIYHIEFENQRELTHSMMRLQEFYEGVDETIRGNFFTMEEFLHHFTNEHGEFRYTEIWSGFNIPGQVVEKWFDLFQTGPGGLTEKERQVMIALFQKKSNVSPWYLIANAKRPDSAKIIMHELAHAKYYLNEDYRASCAALINKINEFDLIYMRNCLMDIGYAEYVIDDEIQAYLSTSTKPELKYFFGKLSKDVLKLVDDFRLNFKNKVPKKKVETVNV